MSDRPPPVPTAAMWRGLGIEGPVELHAGKQSRVFDARRGAQRVAVKLTDGRLADPALLLRRMDAVASLAQAAPAVVAPLDVDGCYVGSIEGWLVTMTPFIDGRELVASAASDARRMGDALAGVHGVFARALHTDLPSVAALRGSHGEKIPRGWQPLHGDFSTKNVLLTAADDLRVFDFDDCGYGPVEYDIANSLYMEFFDAHVNDKLSPYETFRPSFLAGYAEHTGRPVDESRVDELVAVRIDALARWLDDLTNAPIGIRTASPDWLTTLRRFVEAHQVR